MTGPEHYAEAERLLAVDYAKAKSRAAGWTVTPVALSEAQVHATLALAAATALGREGGDGRMPARDRAEWFGVAAVPWKEG